MALFLFDKFLFDTRTRYLCWDLGSIVLRAKTARLLTALLLQQGKVIPREALHQRLWQAHISPNTSTQSIRELRNSLGDDPRRPRFIASINGEGYKWIYPNVKFVRTHMQYLALRQHKEYQDVLTKIDPEALKSEAYWKLPRLAVSLVLFYVLGAYLLQLSRTVVVPFSSQLVQLNFQSECINDLPFDELLAKELDTYTTTQSRLYAGADDPEADIQLNCTLTKVNNHWQFSATMRRDTLTDSYLSYGSLADPTTDLARRHTLVLEMMTGGSSAFIEQPAFFSNEPALDQNIMLAWNSWLTRGPNEAQAYFDELVKDAPLFPGCLELHARITEARGQFHESESLWRALLNHPDMQDAGHRTRNMAGLGRILLRKGCLSKAKERLMEARLLALSLRDLDLDAWIQLYLAEIERESKNFSRVSHLHESALNRFTERGGKRGLAETRFQIGAALLINYQNYTYRLNHLLASLRMFEELGDLQGQARVCHVLSLLPDFHTSGYGEHAQELLMMTGAKLEPYLVKPMTDKLIKRLPFE